MSKPTTNRFSAEVRSRAVWMVLDHQAEHTSQWTAISSIVFGLLSIAEGFRHLSLTDASPRIPRLIEVLLLGAFARHADVLLRTRPMILVAPLSTAFVLPELVGVRPDLFVLVAGHPTLSVLEVSAGATAAKGAHEAYAKGS